MSCRLTRLNGWLQCQLRCCLKRRQSSLLNCRLSRRLRTRLVSSFIVSLAVLSPLPSYMNRCGLLGPCAAYSSVELSRQGPSLSLGVLDGASACLFVDACSCACACTCARLSPRVPARLCFGGQFVVWASRRLVVGAAPARRYI